MSLRAVDMAAALFLKGVHQGADDEGPHVEVALVVAPLQHGGKIELLVALAGEAFVAAGAVDRVGVFVDVFLGDVL